MDEALIKIEQSNESQLELKILKSMVMRKKQMFAGSLTLGQEALSEAREGNKPIQELGALIQLAYTSMMISRVDQGSVYITEFEALWKGLSKEEKENFKELKGYLYHIKGFLSYFNSEHDQAIAKYEKSLEIQNSIESSTEILSTINNLSVSHIYIGEYDIALDYAKQQLAMIEELDNQDLLISAFEHLGHLEELKGEYDLNLNYYTKALNIANELNLRYSIASCKGEIGRIYYLKGEYEISFKKLVESLTIYEDIDMPAFTARVIFDLIKVCIKLELSQQTDNYMLKMNKLYESNKINEIEFRKKLSQALILKNKARSQDKISSQKIFEEVIVKSIDVEISSFAILNLCELLLDELKLYGSEEVLEEVDEKTRQLYELAQEHRLYPLIVKVLILRAKLSFLTLELDEATKILNQANLIAEERGLKELMNLVDKENKNLESEILHAAEITKRASTIQDRIDKARIIEYIENLQDLIKISQD